MNIRSHPFLHLNAGAAQALPWRDAQANCRSGANAPAMAEVGQLLARLLEDETALYAITRECRYDAQARKFVRVHALLDGQFTEIGGRLMQLAARSRALAGCAPDGRVDQAENARVRAPRNGGEAHMPAELLGLHEALLTSLREGRAMFVDRSHDRETTDLLAGLIGDHERHAFMLRALLWAVRNIAA